MTTHAARASATGERIVDIVVPVRQAAKRLRRCIESVLGSSGVARYSVIVVVGPQVEPDDVSPAANAIRDARVRVVRPGSDSAYVAAINHALASHDDRDVVLLQPDAQVNGDWLDRLVSHAGDGAGVIATFTNAGGIAAYPCPGEINRLPEGTTPASLDAHFAKTNRGESVDIAGAFGPCLYITRACMVAAGGFDAGVAGDAIDAAIEFGLRAESAGFRSRVAADVFVSANGGERAAREPRHSPRPPLPASGVPDDSQSSRGFSGRDGTLPFARRVDLARLAASSRPAIVFIAHGWGGGIRRHMSDLATLAERRVDVLFIEPASDFTVKLHWPRVGECFSAWFRLPENLPALADTLRGIGVARLHFHHIHGLPRSILELPRESGIAYDCTLHDYFAICPQYHLVDEHGRYCGEPDAAGCAACLARRPGQWGLDIGSWRRELGAFLQGAARVIAPSHDVEVRMRRYFPSLSVAVWPHAEAAPTKPSAVVRVVTLGTLSPEKGLRVVAACTSDARVRGLPLTFRVLGATTEPMAQSPDAPLTIHGSYADGQLSELLAAERADVLFFPAQVPETYAYTLSVALATDTPIVASEIGALGERLAGRPRVRMLPFDADPAQWNAALLEVARETSLRPLAERVVPDPPAGAAP